MVVAAGLRRGLRPGSRLDGSRRRRSIGAITCRIASPPSGCRLIFTEMTYGIVAGEESGDSLSLWRTTPYVTANPGTADLRRPGSRGERQASALDGSV